jgi:hypothetical protein
MSRLLERELTHPSYSIVLIMNPNVGLTELTSSPMIFFTIVVFPALSKPLSRMSVSSESVEVKAVALLTA